LKEYKRRLQTDAGKKMNPKSRAARRSERHRTIVGTKKN
jgi:hypothetical protein